MHKKVNFKHSDASLKKIFQSMYAYDLAVLYFDFDEAEKKRFLSLVSLSQLSEVFIELEVEEQLDLLSQLEENQKKALLRKIESDDLKEFISDLEEEQREPIYKLLSQVKAKTIQLLMTYDEDVAASIMTTDFIQIQIDSTIKDATNMITTTSKENDYIDGIYVVDDEKRLVGVIDLKELIIARSTKKLEDIMNEDFHFVYDDESIETAIQTIKDYDRKAIPVLDHEDRIIGIVTADDVFDELIENVEYDYQKMALLNDHDSTSSAWTRSMQRLPWLMIAVVLELFVASFLSIFEATIIEVTALVLFQPLILGMAGNIGTQALAVTILGFNTDAFDGKKVPKKHVIKEVTVGFMNSLMLGIASFIFVSIFLSIVPTGHQVPYQIAFVVFIAIFSSMFISSFLGVMIPILFNKMGTDPAAASGPIMTTINDLVALVIYFGVATLYFL